MMLTLGKFSSTQYESVYLLPSIQIAYACLDSGLVPEDMLAERACAGVVLPVLSHTMPRFPVLLDLKVFVINVGAPAARAEMHCLGWKLGQ